MTRDKKDLCACFGSTGYQASTFVDKHDVERCDLCGGRCRIQPGSTSRRRRRLLAAGAASAVASSVAIWLIFGRSRPK